MNLDRFYIAMATLSWSRVFFLGAALGAFYFFSIFNDAGPLKSETENGKIEIASLRKQLKVTRDAIANADRFEQEVQAIVDQFNRIVDYMPPTISTAELTTMLSEYATKAGLRLVRTVPQGAPTQAEFYETTKLAIGLEGKFAQVVTFLSLLSQSNKILTFDKAELTPVNGNSTDLDAPKLIFTGVLVGYRYVSPKKTDEAAKPASTSAPTSEGSRGSL
jgi:Tfp pilus assembly protein PilO